MIFTKKNYLFCLTAALLFAPQARADSACHFSEQADLQLSHPEQSRTPTVDGEINGKPVKFLLDTGASRTYVMRAEADRQNLNPERINQQTQGVGGLTSIFLVKIKDFAIGNAHATNLRFPVIDAMEHTGAAGLVGVDFLMQYDVELNFADHRIKLFRAEHCQERDLAYWDQHAMSVPMAFFNDSKHTRVQVKVNGTTMWAMIDSGASRTLIDGDAARKLGFSAAAPGVTYSGKIAGIGPEKRDSWNMTFDSFAIGDEVVQHPRIAVMDGWDGFRGRKEFDIILGRDFLAAHHVMLATSQGLFYYSYNGGQVFPTHERSAAKPEQAAP
jgi:predicted aspartyl protease